MSRMPEDPLWDNIPDDLRDVGPWTAAKCPTCGGPAETRQTGLRAVAATGDECAASREWRAGAETQTPAALAKRLRLIRQLLGAVEINPSNYDHAELVAVNDAATLAYFIAGGTPTDPGAADYRRAVQMIIDEPDEGAQP